MTSARSQMLSALKPGCGVKEDFNAFLHHFIGKNTLRYEDFADLWKELRMPYLLVGRVEYELREAVGYSCSCAINMFNSSVNIQTKICSIYLLYAVYETQSLYPKAKIRVTPAQFVTFTKFVDEMAAKQHYDFVFVFTRLRMERAFLYVATATTQGKLKKNEVNINKMRELLPTSLVSTFSDISLDLVEDLAVVNEEYYRVKCVATNPAASETSIACAGTAAGTAPHPSVDLAKPEFVRVITRELAKFDNWRKTGQFRKRVASKKKVSAGGATTSESEGDNPSDSDSAVELAQETIAEKRQKLRDKAYGTVSVSQRSTRYRMMVAESTQSSDNAAAAVNSIYTSRKAASKGAAQAKRKQKPTDKEIEQMDETNAYLQTATAPSKKEQRRRRRANKLVLQQAATSSAAAAGAADEDSED